jgi:DnaJ-class molecular chaperone
VNRKSHYTILGITRGATPERVRAAFRHLAKERHPDHAGEASAPAFREIQHAYDVLSDPERRRRYDREHEQKRPARSWRPDSATHHQPVEPLVPVPTPPAPVRLRRPLAFDDLWDVIDAGLTPVASHWRRQTDVVDVDVVVSVELAARGGPCTVEVPVQEICGHCRGTGIRWPSSCPACGQTGWRRGVQRFRMLLPPGVRHGTVVHLQPDHQGGAGLRLRLLVGSGRRAPPVW